jgi:hypothetical protein
MSFPAMRVIVDGDSDKVYRQGDKVTGRVVLVVEEADQIQSLKVVFAGNCITKTSRPFHVNGGANSLRHEYEEKIRLFNQEKEIIAESTLLAPKKYTWTFEFTFPESTTPRFKRLSHGANYLKEPHTLPPTFQLRTHALGGAAQISYFVQARLTFGGSRGVKRCRVVLPYHPPAQANIPREARCTSAVLYGQAWKPKKDVLSNTHLTVTKALSKVSRRTFTSTQPRVIPSLLYPETVAPGQHIPISLVLRNTRDALNTAQQHCTIDSVCISISTYSTSMCGQSITQPEDVVSKHVTCIAKTNMNKHAPFNTTVPLTNNFHLIDDRECVPSFKTYTITRRYALSISVGVSFGTQHFTVRSTTPLDIVPRLARRVTALPDEDEEEQLPLYRPREPSKEYAPDYEVVCALARVDSGGSSTASAGSSSAGSLLAPTFSRSSSYMTEGTGSSGASTAASTPESEVGGFVFEVPAVRS